MAGFVHLTYPYPSCKDLGVFEAWAMMSLAQHSTWGTETPLAVICISVAFQVFHSRRFKSGGLFL